MTDPKQDGNSDLADEWDLELVDQLLEMPPGAGRDALLARLPDSLRVEIEPLLAAGDLAWESQFVAPPTEQDPIAAVLGLVPNASYLVNAASLAKARKARGMTVGTLAAQLTQRGWETRARDVFSWENGISTSLPPATVRAIANLLKTTPERLTTGTVTARESSAPTPGIGRSDVAEAARSTTRFRALVARYADLFGVTLHEATVEMSDRMLSTVHRGSHPDQEQMLSSLEALLDALEHRAGGANGAGYEQPSDDSR